MHDGQLHIAAEPARRPVEVQLSQWRGLQGTALRTPGNVNAVFRVGDDLAARFPLVVQDAARSGRGAGPSTAGGRGRGRAGTGRRRHRAIPRGRWRSGSRARAIRCRGASRPGCPAATQRSRAPQRRTSSPTTWPSSSMGCAPTAPVVDASTASVAAGTSRTPTSGSERVSGRARVCSTWPSCGGAGRGFGHCPSEVEEPPWALG